MKRATILPFGKFLTSTSLCTNRDFVNTRRCYLKKNGNLCIDWIR